MKAPPGSRALDRAELCDGARARATHNTHLALDRLQEELRKTLVTALQNGQTFYIAMRNGATDLKKQCECAVEEMAYGSELIKNVNRLQARRLSAGHLHTGGHHRGKVSLRAER